MIIEQIFAGFFVKSIASFDDTLTRIPLIAEITRGKKGKIAFSIGTLLALTLIIIVVPISVVLNWLPYSKYIIASLIMLLAFIVYFEFLFAKTPSKIHSSIKPNFTTSRFIKLVITGFVVSFVTLIDDSLILVPLFVNQEINKVMR